MERTSDEATIQLVAGEGGEVRGPTAVGTGRREEDQLRLSEIIDVLNERFGTSYSPEDQLFFDQITETAQKDEEVIERAHANAFDNFSLAIRKKIADFMIDRLSQSQEIVSRYFNEGEFQDIAFREVARRIYDEIRRDAA